MVATWAKQLHTWLIPTTEAPSRRSRQFWFWLSLAITFTYSIPVLQEAFSSPYVVQDDARQHVFWMRRFADPGLFPGDAIADYFQSVAPWGYTLVYRAIVALGIDALTVSKLLPPVLALVTVGFAYEICLLLIPVPVAGAIASLLTTQLIWAHDDVASGSPRAFMLPLFLAFLYFLMRRNLVGCIGSIVLLGLFYPQYVFVASGLLVVRLVGWHGGRFRLGDGTRRIWVLSGGGLLAAFLVLLPFALRTSEYGPIITAEAARQLPDFFAGGRGNFFTDDPWEFWLLGMRSGLMPTLKPPLMILGIFLPLLRRFPRTFPLTQRLRHLGILWQLPLVAIALFLAAHALLFRLHLPSRYSGYTLRFTLVFAGAIALVVLLDGILRELSQLNRSWLSALALWGAGGLLTILLLGYPLYDPDAIDPNYTRGRLPETYAFLAAQPVDIKVASLLRDADHFPTFTQRSVLASREYAIPYHVGYAAPMRQRIIELIAAQYALNPPFLQQTIEKYGIDYWLIDDDSFNPQDIQGSWIRQYPRVTAGAIANLNEGTPLLARLADTCQVLEERERVLISADCILKSIREQTVTLP